MRFRRFSPFNQALIAKQVWRMIVFPDLLVSQVFKARYFRGCDIMDAQLGSNLSFVWRPLCWGRELLRQGLSCLVLNGSEIDVGRRNWFANWGL